MYYTIHNTQVCDRPQQYSFFGLFYFFLFFLSSMCTELSQWLVDNKLVEHLFGPNLHVEVSILLCRVTMSVLFCLIFALIRSGHTAIMWKTFSGIQGGISCPKCGKNLATCYRNSPISNYLLATMLFYGNKFLADTTVTM